VLDFISDRPLCKTHYCLTDPSDPRYQFVLSLRSRIYDLLHAAIAGLKNNGADDAIDCVKMIISTIKTLMLDYPLDRTDHNHAKKSYEFAKQITRFSKHQKKHPRFVWVRRANLYHSSRLRLNSYYRKRSVADDRLIKDLADLSRSLYTAVRKSAQRALEALVPYFDGVRSLVIEDLLNSLKPGTDSDVMKGALYVLGMKFFSNFAVLDWRFAPQYILALLGCQHQEKPSIQTLIRNICTEFIVRLAEPCTILGTLNAEELKSTASAMDKLISPRQDSALLQAVEEKRRGRDTTKDAAIEELVPKLLEVAEGAKTHWRYKTFATRFLRALIRRDHPLDPRITKFMSDQAVSDLPTVRGHAEASLTKILHFVKLRSFSTNPVQLLLQESHNPLKEEVTLPRPLPATFTKDFLVSLTQPITAPETKLSDKQSTGWMIWGDKVQLHRPPPAQDSPFQWESASADGLGAIRQALSSPGWWSQLNKHLSQEQTRNYLAADNAILLKSIFQIFGDSFLEIIKPIIESEILDSDRHKQRAGAELLSGVIRGSKHWPLVKQDQLAAWLTPLLPQIVTAITPDSQDAIEMLVGRF
jgi:proteasome activator subunit 4